MFEADIGAINGMDSGDTEARQGSHSAQLWGSGWGKGSASPTRLSRRAGKPGRQQRGNGSRTRPQQEGWTAMSQDIVKAMDDLYGNVSFKSGNKGNSGGKSQTTRGPGTVNNFNPGKLSNDTRSTMLGKEVRDPVRDIANHVATQYFSGSLRGCVSCHNYDPFVK